MANQEATALYPHAAVVDAHIVATGRPNSRNRRRLRQARQAMSQAMTERLFGTNNQPVGAV